MPHLIAGRRYQEYEYNTNTVRVTSTVTSGLSAKLSLSVARRFVQTLFETQKIKMKSTIIRRRGQDLSQNRALRCIEAILFLVATLFLIVAHRTSLNFDMTKGQFSFVDDSNLDTETEGRSKKTEDQFISVDSSTTAGRRRRWNETEIASYIAAHPQRNYFAHLFGHGGFRKGIEIGVQDGRFSDNILSANRFLEEKWSLVLVDPFPTKYLNKRMRIVNGDWRNAGFLEHCGLTFHETISTDPALLNSYPDGHFDFVYLDGSHTHDAVKSEMPLWWKKVRSGGILAGHDYCNYGEKGLSCNGCDSIPLCQNYTDSSLKFPTESADLKKGRASNQNGVVMAVQEWMIDESGDPTLTVRHTLENFTPESLEKDGFKFEDVIRRDRNPSWFIYKP